MLKFMKNKQTNKFDVIGPVADLATGSTVEVTRADGSVTEVVLGKVSKSFIAKFGPHEGKEVAIAVVAEYLPEEKDHTSVEPPPVSTKADERYDAAFTDDDLPF